MIIHKKWVLAFLVCLAAPALAVDSPHTVETGLTNILIFMKAIFAVIWNLKAVIGLTLVLGSSAYYFRMSRQDGQSSVVYPMLAFILGGLLVVPSGIELGAELLALDVQQKPMQLDADGRANVTNMAKYKLKPGKNTQ